MDKTCAELGGQRRGFHTFVMTGDAIIRTNYNTNPFKPTRQLSLDSNVRPTEKVRPERCVSEEVRTTESNPQREEGEREAGTLATSPHSRSREFIPGFMRVDEGGERSAEAGGRRHVYTEDSGIDVHLSDDTEEDLHPSPRNTKSDTQAGSVDHPSAQRLATRLYQLDGFGLTDVCHYLSKSDEFSLKVVAEFLKFFDFMGHSLVESLRAFLRQTSLQTTLEDKERILLHFTKRYLECNQLTQLAQTFHSEDSCHTLVCALVLLNEDLHNPKEKADINATHKLFIENLSQLNGGKDFSKDLLTNCFHDVRSQSLTAAEQDVSNKRLSDLVSYGVEPVDVDSQPHIEYEGRCYPTVETTSITTSSHQISSGQKDLEFMKGYLLKKHCAGPKGVKTPRGKRGWKRHYGLIQDLKLLLLKSDRHLHSKSKTAKFIDLDNAFAVVATQYKKRKHVFAITTADGSEFMFVAGSKDAMSEWISCINLTAAAYSTQKEDGSEVSSRLGSSLSTQPGTPQHMSQQLRLYESRVRQAGNQVLHNADEKPQKGATKQQLKIFKEKRDLQQLQLQKYTVYMNGLRGHLGKLQNDSGFKAMLDNLHSTDSMYVAGSRMSYRQAVYYNK